MKWRIFNRFGLTLYVIKTALAAGLAWYAASLISHNQYPYFAALGGILTVQVTVVDSINKGVYRVVGIIGGVFVSVIIREFLPLNAGSITLVVLVGMAIFTAFRLNSQIISQVGVSSILVLAFGGQPGYSVDRILETFIGCIIAVLLNIFLIPPNPIPEAEKRVLDLSKHASNVLKNLAIAYREQCLKPIDMPYVQELVSETEKSYQAVQFAQQSLRFSPILQKRRSQFLALAKVISRYELITVQIRGIACGLVDLDRRNSPMEELIKAISDTAICVGLFAEREITPSAELKEKLAFSIEQAKSYQNKCLHIIHQLDDLTVLRDIASILADLNRILVEVNSSTHFITEKKITLKR
ncbi:hypothetical protein AN964_04210 [Heyndrickxia shackletonii]|uniref:Aromatic acid exporter family protein n=1 Tax=Heyndrickxia shackletonii TaxID=157838 RepID=A0A0Q3TFC4_9BACI|nr:aromatic acid exporter family protein [Heyndrickxia shackletonii]KQL52800.1 hypothetical protein AN964_04210 [Heyndrickxia shackletonii]NEZ00064.1 hypothetical protein [Heyndrickxia shackletonii]